MSYRLQDISKFPPIHVKTQNTFWLPWFISELKYDKYEKQQSIWSCVKSFHNHFVMSFHNQFMRSFRTGSLKSDGQQFHQYYNNPNNIKSLNTKIETTAFSLQTTSPSPFGSGNVSSLDWNVSQIPLVSMIYLFRNHL